MIAVRKNIQQMRGSYAKTNVSGQSLIYRFLKYTLIVDFLLSPLLIFINESYRLQIAGLSILQLGRGIILVLLIFCLSQIVQTLNKRLLIFHVVLLLGVFSALLTFTVLQPRENIIATVRLIYPALLGIATYLLVSKNLLGSAILRWFAWYWLLAYSITQIFSFYTGKTVYESMYASAGLGSSGSSADILIFLIPFFLLSARFSKWDLLGICIAIISASLTMRKTAVLGIFVSFFIGVAVRTMKRKGDMGGKLVALLFCAIIILGFYQALQSTGWGEDFSLRLADRTGSGRNYIWAQGVEHLGDRSVFLNLLGEGEGSYPAIMLKKIGFTIGSHSGWLNLVISYGVVGVVVYLYFFNKLWRLLQESRKLPGSGFEVVAALMGGILVAETTQGFLLSPAAVSAYVLIGFLLAQNQKTIVHFQLQQPIHCIKNGHRALRVSTYM